jgi:ribosomal protein S12 methylthiotransferase
VKLQRQKALMKVQAGISKKLHRALIGKVFPVLVDGPSEENELVLAGRLQSQAPDVDGVVFLDEAPEDVRAGQIRAVRITRASDYDLIGRVDDSPAES